jgi:hypothetical protein
MVQMANSTALLTASLASDLAGSDSFALMRFITSTLSVMTPAVSPTRPPVHGNTHRNNHSGLVLTNRLKASKMTNARARPSRAAAVEAVIWKVDTSTWATEASIAQMAVVVVRNPMVINAHVPNTMRSIAPRLLEAMRPIGKAVRDDLQIST